MKAMGTTVKVLLVVIGFLLAGCAGTQIEGNASDILHSVAPDSLYGTASDEDVMLLPTEAEQLLARRFPVHLSHDAKFERLVEMFRDGKRGLGLRYVADATRSATEAFAQRNGNCLSFSLLFVAMARAVGLHARFQIMPVPPTWDRIGDLLSNYRHIAVFVRIGDRTFNVDFGQVLRSLHVIGRMTSDRHARAQYFNNIGARIISDGDPGGAVPYFKRALQLAPELSFAWSNLGLALMRDGRNLLAERAFRNALALKPDESAALTNISSLFVRTGRKAEIANFAERLSKAQGRNPYYSYFLGERAFEKQRYDDARRHYLRAIRRKKDDPMFHFRLAQTLFNSAAPRRALRAYRRAQKMTSDADQRIYFETELRRFLTEMRAANTGSG